LLLSYMVPNKTPSSPWGIQWQSLDCRYPCAAHWFPAPAAPHVPCPGLSPWLGVSVGSCPAPGSALGCLQGSTPQPPRTSPAHPLLAQLGGQTREQAGCESVSSSGPSEECQLSARRNPRLPPQQISQGCAICQALG